VILLFWYKIFNVKYDIVVAICDEELLGKKLKYGNVNIEISEKFYKGDIVDEEGAIKLIKLATIGNLIGEKIISIAEKEGFISKENILFIDGVPHAQFVKI
jgi:uncharacterized protein